MALQALILVILADDSKIVLPALFAFAFGLVTWSLIYARGKADKKYVDEKFNEQNKKISDVEQSVISKIEVHERNDDRIREQYNCTVAEINQKLGIILDKLIPEQTIKQPKTK